MASRPPEADEEHEDVEHVRVQEISQLVGAREYRIDPEAVAGAILARMGGEPVFGPVPGSEHVLVTRELEALARPADA